MINYIRPAEGKRAAVVVESFSSPSPLQCPLRTHSRSCSRIAARRTESIFDCTKAPHLLLSRGFSKLERKLSLATVSAHSSKPNAERATAALFIGRRRRRRRSCCCFGRFARETGSAARARPLALSHSGPLANAFPRHGVCGRGALLHFAYTRSGCTATLAIRLFTQITNTDAAARESERTERIARALRMTSNVRVSKEHVTSHGECFASFAFALLGALPHGARGAACRAERLIRDACGAAFDTQISERLECVRDRISPFSL